MKVRLACLAALLLLSCVARTSTTFHPTLPVAPAALSTLAAVRVDIADVEVLVRNRARLLGTAEISDDSRPTRGEGFVMGTVSAAAAKLGATHFTPVATWTHADIAHTVHLLWLVPVDRWPALPAALRPRVAQ